MYDSSCNYNENIENIWRVWEDLIKSLPNEKNIEFIECDLFDLDAEQEEVLQKSCKSYFKLNLCPYFLVFDREKFQFVSCLNEPKDYIPDQYIERNGEIMWFQSFQKSQTGSIKKSFKSELMAVIYSALEIINKPSSVEIPERKFTPLLSTKESIER